MEFSSGKSLRKCVKRGIGLTLCPTIAIEQDLEQKKLVSHKVDGIIEETPVLMIYHIDKWCSPLLRQFMELTQEFIKCPKSFNAHSNGIGNVKASPNTHKQICC